MIIPNTRLSIKSLLSILILMMLLSAQMAQASGCSGLPGWAKLKHALKLANNQIDLTLNNQMWATIVSADGRVCSVAHSGINNLQSQWLASRVISAQKANTANSLSLMKGQGGDIPGLALSSGNLWAAVQPGGSLFGLQHSNPVNTHVAYRGASWKFGRKNDPMVNGRIGGINVFGGGLAIYNSAGVRVGGIGVSGDTSCRDHMVAWELRHILNLDYVPAGLSNFPRPDNIIFDIDENGDSPSGFGHPNCLDKAGEISTANNLSPTR